MDTKRKSLKMGDFLDNIEKRSMQGAGIGAVIGGALEKASDVVPESNFALKGVLKASKWVVTGAGALIGLASGATIGVVETFVDAGRKSDNH